MLEIGLVLEGQDDVVTATEITDQVIRSVVPGAKEGDLAAIRRWSALDGQPTFVKWSSVPRLAKGKKFRIRGKFRGGHSHVTREALLLFQERSPAPDGVILLVDTDGDDEREGSILRAVEEGSWPFFVVVGAANRAREHWLLVGFNALDTTEKRLLKECKAELGFDPCADPLRLTSRHPHEPLSAKRVCKLLMDNVPDRERLCLENLALLQERDRTLLKRLKRDTGLSSFIERLSQALSKQNCPTVSGTEQLSLLGPPRHGRRWR